LRDDWGGSIAEEAEAWPVWGYLLRFAGEWGVATGGIDRGKFSVLYTGDPYPGPSPYVHTKVEPMPMPLLYLTPIMASTAHHGGISTEHIQGGDDEVDGKMRWTR